MSFVTSLLQVMLLTGEGGRLKRNVPLVQGRDFVLVPDSLWKALQQWYGGAPALPRQVRYKNGALILCYLNKS